MLFRSGGNKFDGVPDELFDAKLLKLLDSFLEFITTKGILVFLAGMGCLICSYFVSVLAFVKKGDTRL